VRFLVNAVVRMALNCYEKNNKKERDLMWDLDMYARLDLADSIIDLLDCYASTSNLKLMFVLADVR
jgi:hypothetical protein